MASVRDIQITEALLTLYLAYYEALWLSRIEIWGAHFMSIFSVFSVMAEWSAEILFMLFFAYISV